MAPKRVQGTRLAHPKEEEALGTPEVGVILTKKQSIQFNFSSVRCVVAPIKRFQGTPRPSLGFWLLFPYARHRSRGKAIAAPA